MEFIDANRDRPFFCYLAFNTPHSPMQVPDRFFEKFKDAELPMRYGGPEKEDVAFTRAALAMCENLDWNVGRVLARLDERRLADRTIVLYFCDNGPNGWRWNGGMRGRKGSTDEGGVRAPLLLRWPGHVPPGTRVATIAGAIDLLPTLAGLAGVPVAPHADKPLDGTDLSPVVLGGAAARRPGRVTPGTRVAPIADATDLPSTIAGLVRVPVVSLPDKPLDGTDFSPISRGGAARLTDRRIFSHWNGKVSVRTQQYRLDASGRLYDMTADPGQHRDIARERPDVAADLSRAVADWSRELLPGLTDDRRPFPVGYRALPITWLPARDGVPHGHIRRSAAAPNCSYFTNWSSTDDRITWDVEVATTGRYEAVVYYTAAASDVGAVLEISFGASRVLRQGRQRARPSRPRRRARPRPPSRRVLRQGLPPPPPGRRGSIEGTRAALHPRPRDPRPPRDRTASDHAHPGGLTPLPQRPGRRPQAAAGVGVEADDPAAGPAAVDHDRPGLS